MLNSKLLLVLSLFIFSACSDLEPEMQDTRTVILNMDFNKRSFSRTVSSVSESELNQYNTHLILAVPAGENLTSNYLSYYYSSFDAGLMNPQDRRVNLEIPLNTQIKVFAFLFQGNYSMDALMQTREIGYYGQSGSFFINTQTNNLSLGVNLQSTGNTVYPVLSEINEITPTIDTSPDYSFSSTKAGVITYGGSCSSATTNAIVGDNNITFNTLNRGNYSDCIIKVTDSEGNVSNNLVITSFTVLPNGIISYYPFDGNANDKIGSFDGSVSGAKLSTGRNDITNSAYLFDKTDSSPNYIELGTGMLSGNGEFSILIWIKTTQDSSARIQQQRDAGGYNGEYMLDLKSDGKIKFTTFSGGSYKWSVTSSVAVNNGQWHHLAFVQQLNGGQMYLNGTLNQTDNINGRVTLLSTLKTYIGGDLRNNNSYFSGKVDDLKIYNRALTENEIQILYKMID